MGSEARGVWRGLGLTLPAVASSAGMGLAFLFLAGRVLGVGEYARFLGFWSTLFLLGALLAALESEVARTVRSSALGGSSAGGEVRRVLEVMLGGVLLVGGVLAALERLTLSRLFAGRWVLLGLVVAAGAGFALQYTVRGVLVGSGRVKEYAGITVVEAVLRLGVLGGGVVLGREGLEVVCVAVCAGSLAWVPWVKVLLPVLSSRGGAWKGVGHRCGSLVGAGAFTAVLVTGWPAVVGLLGYSGPGVGSTLGALSLSRAPLLAFSAAQGLLVPALVSARREGREGSILASLVLAVTGVGAVAVVGASVVGPSVVRAVYGGDFLVGHFTFGLLCLSAVVMVLLLVFAGVLVAREAHPWVVASWAGACVAALAVLSAGGAASIGASLAVGAGVGACVALWGVRRTMDRVSIQREEKS